MKKTLITTTALVGLFGFATFDNAFAVAKLSNKDLAGHAAGVLMAGGDATAHKEEFQKRLDEATAKGDKETIKELAGAATAVTAVAVAKGDKEAVAEGNGAIVSSLDASNKVEGTTTSDIEKQIMVAAAETMGESNDMKKSVQKTEEKIEERGLTAEAAGDAVVKGEFKDSAPSETPAAAPAA